MRRPAENSEQGAIAGGSRAAWLRRAVVGALLLDGAAPFWSGRFLPFLDLPQHLALARILGDPSDAVAGFEQFFRIDHGPTPYWGYLAPMWALTRILPLELANRILLSLWAIALPVSVARALRAFGRDWRWAAFSLPLIWNSHLFYGFTAMLVSMPIFFWTLALSAEAFAGGAGRARSRVALAVLAIVVFCAHVQTYLLLVVSIVALAVIAAGGARAIGGRLVPLLPSIALLALFVYSQLASGTPPISPLHAEHSPRYGQVGSPEAWSYEPPSETLSRMPARLWGGYSDGSDDWLGMAWLLLLVVALLVSRGSAAARLPTGSPWRESAGEVACLVAFAAYLFLPEEFAGQPWFNQKYLVFAALLAPSFLVAPATGGRRWLLAAAAALGFVAHVNAAWKIALFQREAAGFEAVLETAEPGRRLLGLVFDRGELGAFRLGPFLHFPAYYVARQGGDAGLTFAGRPAIPIRYRAGAQARHPSEWRPWEFDWRTMSGAYDYFLLRGRTFGGATEIERRGRLVAAAGAWRLYARNRLEPP
ncbi:MAG TPA: hypothetical protein VI942_03520 [Thermoanaerobaculia bacterium]|nr:hypothetical protein [Thermoanaerobaculia bacterium]